MLGTQSAKSKRQEFKSVQRLQRVLLCRPDYFDVDYIINPLMQPHSVDRQLALKQWLNLKSTYEKIGVEVEVINQEQGVPDMVFATDHGVVLNGSVLLANFRYNQRRKESVYFQKWFTDYSFNHKSLNPLSFLEGGDTRFFGDKLFVGSGFRASENITEEIQEQLGIEVVQLKQINPEFYHLDMAFLPINKQTAFYCPEAFDLQSQKILKQQVPNLIKLNKKAAHSYAANSVVSGKDILTQCTEPSFLKVLSDNGLNVHQVDVSEFNKAGGGIRCLTLILDMEEN